LCCTVAILENLFFSVLGCTKFQPSLAGLASAYFSQILQGRRLTFAVGYSKIKQGSSSGCISTFSVNLTFDKTLVMRFCYFYAQIATFWAINV